MTPSLAEEVKLIPREVLFGNPVKASPQISPDGKRIAYLAPFNNVLNVWVRTLGREDGRKVTQDTDRGIRFYFWGMDGRHVLYLQDAGGNENWRLYAVDLPTGAVRDLTPFENVQVRVVGVDKRFPNEVLLAMNKENPQVHDVYRLDLAAGELRMAAKNPGDVAEWLADADFKIRGCMAAREDGGYDLLVREREDAEWKKILTWSQEDSSTSEPVSFARDGRSLYLKDSRDSDTSRLIRLETASGKKEVLAYHPRYDIGAVVTNPDTYEIEIFSYTAPRREWVVLDPAVKRDVEMIRQIQRGDFSIVSRDNADETWVVGFEVDDGPVSYYAFDRRTKKAEFLFESKPDLKGYALAQMEPFEFTARDGLVIQGFLTFPATGARKDLPMVLNVHGGPWARDAWGYDPEAQWLANRGYLCLQVNYRGSTGFGKNFVNAGDKEWGGKMHEDLVDAVRWAVGKGYADPKRTAIYGGSYGGYAALVGAAFTPDLFACAVDVVGPSNLITFIRTIPPYWKLYLSQFYKKVGNPDTEAEFLKSRSPLFKVEQIKIPMLIAQGANDPRVKQSEAEQIVEAMKKKGIDHEYLLFPDEGHGFAKPENRIKFYAACEKFLSKHLGGRYENAQG
ncbi:MAG: S9 family peptidase [Candidatus Omnitrophica bacterium]|nr:S9 family peptidase [Candidatus Omnitrophota bacterium]